jgi:D-alanyl-D-alanine carboxypeptidase
MSKLKQTVVRALQAIWFPPAESAIRAKVAIIGKDGCVRHMDVTMPENNLF